MRKKGRQKRGAKSGGAAAFISLLAAFLAAAVFAVAQQEPETVIDAAPSFQYTLTDRFTVPWSGDKSLRVSEGEGQIFVRASSAEAVTFRAAKTAFAPDLAKAREFASRIKVFAQAPADSIVATSSVPSSAGLVASGRVDYDILAPSAISVDLATTSGAIDVSGLEGDAKVKTDSGKILLANIKGAALASSTSGNIDIKDCPKISLIRNGSGEVSFQASGMENDLDIETDSGDIKVKLKRSLKARIVANTVSGAVDTADAYLKKVSEADSELTFETPGAGASVRLIYITTVSGDIIISAD
ncbi:MAG TPA: DUF4097 family beta strand repeat-containing protein [bacterium]|nr:MAG: hypothetical protein BWY28_02557 [bacterium ADurb.Bin236]HOY64792.1 DUF4097 family beta strand repeat-containing protein [bacterium]HPI78065.1 DUF4097 family beta strand repeat-containing protein [bacterium]